MSNKIGTTKSAKNKYNLLATYYYFHNYLIIKIVKNCRRCYPEMSVSKLYNIQVSLV